MKSQITKMLFQFSLLTATISPAVTQEVQLPPNTIVVDSGNDLRCRLDKGLRITKAGEPITARLVEAGIRRNRPRNPQGIDDSRARLVRLDRALEQANRATVER